MVIEAYCFRSLIEKCICLRNIASVICGVTVDIPTLQFWVGKLECMATEFI